MSKANEVQVLSPRTERAYAGDWALFTDWCATTGHRDLPADPDAVTRFLGSCPSAPATLRRRAAAIDHHHSAAGHPRPGESATVRVALGRPVTVDQPAPPDMTDQVAATLHGLPSHGWTHGMFGRRDRCLLVLSQLAGVPYHHLATLTAGNVAVADDSATVTSPAGVWTVTPHDNPVLCGPCAISRWLRVLDTVFTTPSHRVLAKQVRDAEPVTDQSAHLCRSTRELSLLTRAVPLVPPIDQWGYLPFPLQRLTPHSLGRRVRELLAGDFGAHRHLPLDDELPAPEQPPPAPAPARPVYSKQDAQRAWARRHADLKDLDGVDDQLDDIDQRVADLNRRAMALLDGEPAVP